ncbi:alpha/beta fold hydrolase [Larkinella punicea]|uniref:Alpha/beta fold hydrolase n=1 Tax=Larkinella punicea TaxID=2315727 RepID=A0A368JKD2_9BACT|nr:alpha/beta fold hydrolase [Larkinella punicea]RCR68127.1 alpha/beta fold hydrolase [Larkinella punicea]
MLPVFKLSNGPVPLLAFHGIGQDHRAFEPLAQQLEGRYAVYAFDLFFHGSQPAPVSDDVLTKQRFQEIIQAFLHQYQIDRFAVLGFSMGGRFALAVAEAFPKHTTELILLAPDGITLSPWYRIATNTGLGRQLFRYFLKHMPLFHRFGLFFLALGLINRSVLRFAESTLATPEQRESVYNAWVYFRKLQFNHRKLSEILNNHPVRVRFFAGHFDQVLPVSYIKPLSRRLHAYELIVLKTGHNRLLERVGKIL